MGPVIVSGSRCKLFLSIAGQMTTGSSVYSTSIHHFELYTEGFSVPSPSTYISNKNLRPMSLTSLERRRRSLQRQDKMTPGRRPYRLIYQLWTEGRCRGEASPSTLTPHVGRLSHQVKPHCEATSPRIVPDTVHHSK
jgi:hypothetical protein